MAGALTHSWGLGLARWAIARPRRTLALLALVTVAALPGLLRLELRTDGHALVPAADPAVRLDLEIRQRFHLRDPIVVFLESSHPDGIYNPATLGRLRDLTRALAGLPGVGPEQVVSLATEGGLRVDPRTLGFRRLLDPLPESAADLARLKAEVREIGLLTGTLVSAGGEAAAMLLGVPPDSAPEAGGEPPAPHDRTGFYRRVEAAVEPFRGQGDSLVVVGAPVAEALLGAHILEDLALLLPLALAVLALALGWVCRRAWGVVLGLGKIGACLVLTFGLMGWVGEPVYLTTAVLPVILISMGIAEEVHLLWHHQRRLAGAPGPLSHRETVEATLAELARPLTVTAVTTAIGFLSFAASSIRPLASFGLFAAAGILICLAWALTGTPAALALLPPEALAHPGGRPYLGRWTRTQPLGGTLLAPRRLALAAIVVATLALGAGASRIVVQDSWLDGFARGSPFRRATERVNGLLDGTHTLLVQLTFEPPVAEIPVVPGGAGPLLARPTLEAIGALERFLAGRPEVGGVVGPHAQLTTTAFLWGGHREDRRAIPDNPSWIFLLIKRLELVRGPERRRELLADDFRHAVVTVLLKEANYRDTATLIAAIRRYEDERLRPAHGRLDFGGDVAVSQAMIPAIVHGQVSSLLLAVAGSALAIGLALRSLLRGFLAVCPALVAVVWMFGVMGWAGIPLGVATSMFCSITLGIGDDYGIHFLERHALARRAGAADPSATALAESGPAIVADALAVGGGFGLLAVSQVPANRWLGLLVATALGAACAVTLGGLAPLLAPWLRRRSAGLPGGAPAPPAPPR